MTFKKSHKDKFPSVGESVERSFQNLQLVDFTECRVPLALKVCGRVLSHCGSGKLPWIKYLEAGARGLPKNTQLG